MLLSFFVVEEAKMKGKKLRGRPTKAKKRKRKDSEEEDEENVTEPGDLKDEK